MKRLVEFGLADGGQLTVEVDNDDPGVERASLVDDVFLRSDASLERTLDQIRVAAGMALDRLRGMTESPHQIELEFGIRLNAEAGAVIARTQAEGHITAKLTWNGRGGAA